MATYYVKTAADGGSDGAAGTSAATAWATLTKALGASGMASGDTLYVAPGIYRETLVPALTNPTAETKIVGDPLGSRFGLSPGEVRLTGYTTNDTTAPSTASLINSNSKNFLTFENFVFQMGGGTSAVVTLGFTKNWTLRRCFIFNVRGGTNGACISLTTQSDGSMSNVLVDRCVIVQDGSSSGISFTMNKSIPTDYDMGVTVKNCVFYHGGGAAIAFTTSTGTDVGLPGGCVIEHCSFRGSGSGIQASATTHSTTVSTNIKYCFISTSSGTAIAAGASGQFVEDWNRIISSTPRTNTAVGSNSVTGNNPSAYYDFGQAVMWGGRPDLMFTPFKDSPLLGAISDGSDTYTVDAINRIRPSGSKSVNKTWGGYERHEFAEKETTTTQAGTTGIVLTGPGDHEFLVPVNAVSTTITIYARYDTNHAATNKPQAALMANGEIGLALSATSSEADLGYAELKTMTAAVDTWEQLSFTAFTPTQKGVVRIRLISRSAADTGKAFFDSLA